MAYFNIELFIGWQELEPSLIKGQICRKIITQLKGGGFGEGEGRAGGGGSSLKLI